MEKSESIAELAVAFAKFQGEIGSVEKDGKNPFFKSKYATLENIINTVKPVLGKHGLSYAQFPSGEGLTTVLMHTSGQWIAQDAKITIKEQTPQGQGSAITYMRRYALSAALGIATEEDDDGNAASVPVKKPIAAAKPQKPDVVAKAQGKGAELRTEIKKLCDEDPNEVLQSKGDYEAYVLRRTGLKLEPANFETIIERLKSI